MKRLSGTGGYTIVEALIFLVVSASLFASVIGVYSVQNRRTQFYQSVQSFDQKIRDLLNDVDTGFYPTLNNITCTAAGSTVTITQEPAEQGKNQDCVFAGKVLQLTPNSGTYDIYTLAGARQATTIDDAGAKAITFLRDRGALSGGLVVTNVRTVSGTHRGLAVLSSFGDDVSSGSSSVGNRTSLATVNGAVGGDGTIAMGSGNISQANRGVLICLREGNNGRRATILVGGGAQNGTQVTIDGECTI